MKKRKLEEGDVKEAAIASDEESASSAAAKKKSSKKKKSKKRKSSSSKKNVDDDVDSQSVDTTTSTTPSATKEEAVTTSKTDRHAAKKATKAALKLELQSKIPKLDPDGMCMYMCVIYLFSKVYFSRLLLIYIPNNNISMCGTTKQASPIIKYKQGV